MNSKWRPTKVRRSQASLSQHVYSVLREAILSLDLPPGSRLVESELSDAMGTSVTPIREALRRLQSEGLVKLSYARTGFVLGLSVDDIRDLYEVRAVLETWALWRSVPRFDEEGVKELERIVREAQESLERGDLVAFSKTNREFHRELCRRSRNRYLMRLLDNIADQLHRLRVAQAKQTLGLAKEVSADALKEHREIINAVRAGDAEVAAELLHKDISALLEDIETGGLDSLQLILSSAQSEYA